MHHRSSPSNDMHEMNRSFRLCMIVSLLGCVSLAHAADWINSAGCNFSDTSCWNPNVLPPSGATVNFDLASSGYTVIFDYNPTNAQLNVLTDTVTFELMGHTYSLNSGGLSTNIGRDLNDVGALTVKGGTLNAAGRIDIGGAGRGTLSISNNAGVTNGAAVIGLGDTSVGSTVNVVGGGSTWTNNGFLTVGWNGHDTALNVTGGADVSNPNHDGFIAANSGTNNTATVSGAGSTWTNGGELFVGYRNAGVLNVTDGGVVTSSEGSLGWLGDWVDGRGNGTVLVDGAGSQWTMTGRLDVGELGTGDLTISGGGNVTNHRGIVALGTDAVGTVNVMGANSTWTNNEEVQIGWNGAATLNITDGGVVSNVGRGFIGVNATSSSAVSVTGTDSEWNNGGELIVGNLGLGTLSISGGGKVTSTHASIAKIAGAVPGSAVTVDGAGSSWTMGNGHLYVGQEATGSLTISGGGMVSNGIVDIGFGAGALNSFVKVTGSGSTWSNTGDLNVAWNGGATLTIEDGGQVSNTQIGYIAKNFNSTGDVTVSGADSSWDNGGDLLVGYRSGGSLTVTGGGAVTSNTATLGVLVSQSSGTATVDGMDGDQNPSSWTITENLIVGHEGFGDLTISGGGTVSNARGTIAFRAGAIGSAVTVTGPGSTWTNNDGLSVGVDTMGTLDITDGGVVTNAGTEVLIAANGGHTGLSTVSVSGANSMFSGISDLNVGFRRAGQLDVEAGGLVSSVAGFIGTQATASGTRQRNGRGLALARQHGAQRR